MINNLKGIAQPGQFDAASRPKTRREAAKQFEEHLVRQMVDAMFAGVFDGDAKDAGIAGVGRGEMKSHLVEQMTDVLMQKGGLGLANALTHQWTEKFGADSGQTDSEAP
ncbi:MAG: hypothetical protein KDD65_04970 [Bacteroidetes bacterium]|nr:hypothetical protein [Bacteroidota bacterium]